MSTALMAPKKKRNTKGAAIAQAILEQYRPQTKEDMQEAIKDIFGPMFEAMLQGEMDSHLGYEANDHGYKEPSAQEVLYISVCGLPLCFYPQGNGNEKLCRLCDSWL